MGLASSQARMLLLTARKSDLEYRAQMISQRKINLAMQTQTLAQTYSQALNDKVMKFTYTTAKGESQQEILGYDSFKAKSNGSFIGDYLVKTSNGQYAAASDTDKLAIAVKLANTEGLKTEFKTVTRNYYPSENGNGENQELKYSNLRNENYLVRISSDENKENVGKFLATSEEDRIEIANILAANAGEDYSSLSDEDKEDYKKQVVLDKNQCLSTSESLGQACRSGAVSVVKFNKSETEEKSEYINAISTKDIKMDVKKEESTKQYNIATLSQEEKDELLAAYDNQIKVVDGITNRAYFQDALRNGALFLFKKEEENQGYESISWSADRNISDVADSSNDAQAQADYEAKSMVLSNQDKMLDLELNQIETQHKAIETERDSVKKVIEKNIDVSYKIFA